MKFANREPIDEVAALGMPFPEEVILNHGISEVIWGIRDEHENGDIDGATCLENNLYLENKLGFHALQMTVGVSDDGKIRTVVSRQDAQERFDFHRWDFSMFRYNRKGQGRIYLPELGTMSVADPKTGIRVLLPQYYPLEKLETGREKDEGAVERVREYLARQGLAEAAETRPSL